MIIMIPQKKIEEFEGNNGDIEVKENLNLNESVGERCDSFGFRRKVWRKRWGLEGVRERVVRVVIKT